MAATKVFISFDYDHDLDLKNFLVGQAKLADSPFEIEDWSVKNASPGWKADAKNRIARSDQVAVICGHDTHTAVGVNTEIELAREAGKPYFLLAGRATGVNTKPTTALSTDKLYKWTWDNLKSLIAGNR